VERKVNPVNLYRIVRLQFFNTHGTEITPGSDVVGENVKFYLLQFSVPEVNSIDGR
jgi:hypothetical protein